MAGLHSLWIIFTRYNRHEIADILHLHAEIADQIAFSKGLNRASRAAGGSIPPEVSVSAREVVHIHQPKPQLGPQSKPLHDATEFINGSLRVFRKKSDEHRLRLEQGRLERGYSFAGSDSIEVKDPTDKALTDE